MNNTIINKLNYIFKKYYEVPKKLIPCLWNLDTSIFNICKFFRNKIKDLDNKNFEFLLVKKVGTNNNNNPIFKMYIGHKNVTPNRPTIKKSSGLAQNTIRQYLSVLSSFNLINYSNKEFWKNDETKFEINNLITSFKLEEDMKENFINIICYSINSSVKYTRNLGFSIFTHTLLTYNKNIFSYLDKFVFQKIKAGNDGRKKFSSNDNDEINDFILNVSNKRSKSMDYTYKEVSQSFKNSNISLDEFIDYIYYSLDKDEDKNKEIDEDKDKDKNKEIDDEIEKYNIESQINLSASRLRGAILEARVKNQKNYTDLRFLNGDNFERSTTEAAHIFDKWRLKRIAVKNFKDSEIVNRMKEYAQNPNNGLLLDPNLHTSFDKQECFFNINGKLIIRDEFKENPEFKNLANLAIKKEVLNEDMKNFIKMRTDNFS